MSIVIVMPPPPRAPLRSRFEARLAVGAATLLARRKPRVIRVLLSWLASGKRAASRQDVQRAWDTVVGVSRRSSGRRGCLVRSLAVVLLCRWRGSWPTWCVGVRIVGRPEAHAWVEAEGEPVGELPGTAAAYRTILRVGSPSEGYVPHGD